MKKVFAMFDQEGVGHVEVKTFPHILRTLGSSVGKEEIKEKVEEIIKNGKLTGTN